MRKLSTINEDIFNKIQRRDDEQELRKEDEMAYHPNDLDELKELINAEAKSQESNGSDTLDLRRIDVSKIDSFKGLFYDALHNNRSIKIVDVTGWDTSNVTAMNGMFQWCNHIEEIRGLETWNVKNIEDMSFAFAQTSNLKDMDLSTWTLNVVVTTKEDFTFMECGVKYKQQGLKLIRI